MKTSSAVTVDSKIKVSIEEVLNTHHVFTIHDKSADFDVYFYFVWYHCQLNLDKSELEHYYHHNI